MPAESRSLASFFPLEHFINGQLAFWTTATTATKKKLRRLENLAALRGELCRSQRKFTRVRIFSSTQSYFSEQRPKTYLKSKVRVLRLYSNYNNTKGDTQDCNQFFLRNVIVINVNRLVYQVILKEYRKRLWNVERITSQIESRNSQFSFERFANCSFVRNSKISRQTVVASHGKAQFSHISHSLGPRNLVPIKSRKNTLFHVRH